MEFRVIIVIEANSHVNIRNSRLLPKSKTEKLKACVLLRTIIYQNKDSKQHTSQREK